MSLDHLRTLLKAHVKGHTRVVNGRVVYIHDYDTSKPMGREAELHERTAIGKHRSGSHYLRATDAEDGAKIQAAAEKLGIKTEKRRAGANHWGRTGAYDHYHVESPEHALAIHNELKKHGNASAGGNPPSKGPAEAAEAASSHAYQYDNSTKPADYDKAIAAHEAASNAHVEAMDHPGADRAHHSIQADEHAHEARKFRGWKATHPETAKGGAGEPPKESPKIATGGEEPEPKKPDALLDEDAVGSHEEKASSHAERATAHAKRSARDSDDHQRAHGMSIEAENHSDKAIFAGTAEAHSAAAKAHGEASDAHDSLGNHEASEAHDKAQETHMKLARHFEAAGGTKPQSQEPQHSAAVAQGIKKGDFRHILDKDTARKATSWDETKSESTPIKGTDDEVAALRLLHKKHGAHPVRTPGRDVTDHPGRDGEGNPPMEFIAQAPDGSHHYVNTEGYTYPRYTRHIPDEVAEKAGITQPKAAEEMPDARVEHKGHVSTVEFGRNEGRAVLHPEHQEQVGALKDGESTFFEDEQRSRWDVQRKGDHLHFTERGHSGLKGKVRQDQFQPFPKEGGPKATTPPPAAGPRPSEAQNLGNEAGQTHQSAMHMRDAARGAAHEPKAIRAMNSSNDAHIKTLQAKDAAGHGRARAAHIAAMQAHEEAAGHAYTPSARNGHQSIADAHSKHADAHAKLADSMKPKEEFVPPMYQNPHTKEADHLVAQGMTGKIASDASHRAVRATGDAVESGKKEDHDDARAFHRLAAEEHRAHARRFSTTPSMKKEVEHMEKVAQAHDRAADWHNERGNTLAKPDDFKTPESTDAFYQKRDGDANSQARKDTEAIAAGTHKIEDGKVVPKENHGLSADAKNYDKRVRAYEKKGMSRSDAQGVVDAEDMKARRENPSGKPDGAGKPHASPKQEQPTIAGAKRAGAIAYGHSTQVHTKAMHGSEVSEKARAATVRAHGATQNTAKFENESGVSSHKRAADMHRQAAAAHLQEGNTDGHEIHMKAAAAHDTAAKHWEGVTEKRRAKEREEKARSEGFRDHEHKQDVEALKAALNPSMHGEHFSNTGRSSYYGDVSGQMDSEHEVRHNQDGTTSVSRGYRDYSAHTPRPSEEDDDWPDENPEAYAAYRKRMTDRIPGHLKGRVDVHIHPSEKNWLHPTYTLHPKKK